MDVGATRGRSVVGAMVTLAAVLLVGCGSGDAPTPGTSATSAKTTTTLAPGVRAELLASGRRIFDKECSFCHRLDGKRAPRTPPPDAYGTSFEQIQTSERFVIERVTSGFGGMQSFENELSPRQIRAVAMYVIAHQGRAVEAAAAPSQQQLAAGEQVFAARCQRCHSIADREQTAHPSWQPTDFRIVRPSVPFTESVLDGTGNKFMLELMEKIQGKLAKDEIRDVAAYVSAVARPGPPAGG